MTELDNYVELKRQLLQAQLRVVYRYQRKTLPHDLERDSIVSALIKKINARKIFVRVAPNTFALKTNTEKVDQGGAL
ncbi:MAG: hypothetical protein JRJ33_01825 [Deltaproteobacteria bacterium]|nr:hypothetical protein [Deltaproteobacteria bacterium]